MSNLSVALTESKSLRDEKLTGVSNEKAMETLNKAKSLVMALWKGENVATTAQIAEFYEVSEDVVRDNVRRHRDELESDGLKVLRGKSLNDAREIISLAPKTSQETIWNPRCALRLGMVLRDSEVAKSVRTVILDVVESVPNIQTHPRNEPEVLDSKAIAIYKESIEYFADNGDLEIASLLKCHFGNQLLQSKQKALKPINLPEYEGVVDVAMRLGFNVPKNYESALGNHIARQYGHKRIGHNKRYSQSSEKQVCANMYPAYDPEIEKAVSSYCVAKAFYHRDIQMLG